MVSELAPGMEQILSDLDKIDQKITLNFYGTAGFRSLNKLNLFKKPLGDDLREAIKQEMLIIINIFCKKYLEGKGVKNQVEIVSLGGEGVPRKFS